MYSPVSISWTPTIPVHWRWLVVFSMPPLIAHPACHTAGDNQPHEHCIHKHHEPAPTYRGRLLWGRIDGRQLEWFDMKGVVCRPDLTVMVVEAVQVPRLLLPVQV